MEKLNPPQQEAVAFKEGPLLVLAGAGSGKTRVATLRIVRLLEDGVPPSTILGLTFTNKAAEEMRTRVTQRTHFNVLITTFHSLGARILRESISHLSYKAGFTIYDEDDVDKVIKNALSELSIASDRSDVKAYRYLISQAKNRLEAPDQIDERHLLTSVEQSFPRVYREYQSLLKQYNAVDFDDLLFLTVRLFRECPEVLAQYQQRWRYLLIDEYQDTNQAQYEIIRLLVAESKNLFVVGDPDQSIYSWRGANINNILNFELDYPGAKVIRLEQNYRSRSNILEAANALISHNQERYEKSLWSDLGEGDPIRYYVAEDDRDETQFVLSRIRHHQNDTPLNEMVIFYRTNFQSRVLEDRLLALRIPYVIVGGISFYQRREIKDVISFLRMVHSGTDFVSFERTLNLPKRGIGEATIDKLRQMAREQDLNFLDTCREAIHGSVEAPRLSTKQKAALSQYVDIIEGLRRVQQESGLKDLIKAVIHLTGYLQYLALDEETFEDRRQNLEELVSKAAEWEGLSEDTSLAAFLEELSLKSSLDEVDPSQPRVNLMTLHSGKGLEFKVTFLVGMEEDLFPHANAKGNHTALEEERRLCYVGMTRAKEFLYFSSARSRYLWGVVRSMRPSRFLHEIPRQYIAKVAPSFSFQTRR